MLFQILIDFIKEHPILMFINFLFMSFVTVNETFLPYLYGKVINDIFSDSILLILITALIFIQLGFLLRDKISELLVPKFEVFIKNQIISSILEKYKTSYDTLTTGDIVYRLVRLPDIILYWFQCLNDYIIPYFIVFVSAFIYFIKYDRNVGLCYLVFLVLFMLLFIGAPVNCLKLSKSNESIFSNFHEYLEDIIHNMTSILSSNTKQKELQKLQSYAAEYASIYGKTVQCSRTYKFAMIPIITGFLAYFIIRSRYLIKNEIIKITKFTPIFMIFTSMLGSIFWIVDIMRVSVFDSGCIDNVNELLLPRVEIPRPIMNIEAPKNIIGIRNVSFQYGDKVILNNISIDFVPNKINALIGHVGSGKTTIMYILLGFLIPKNGDAYYDGQWYNHYEIEYIRNQIGYVPQNPILFNETIEYNIRYGNPNINYDEMKAITDELNLDLNRKVGKNGMYLSGGQRQIVWCLRILFKNPSVLLMDEPTANMDAESKDMLMRLLENLMKNRTVIIITHDTYLLKYINYTFSL